MTRRVLTTEYRHATRSAIGSGCIGLGKQHTLITQGVDAGRMVTARAKTDIHDPEVIRIDVDCIRSDFSENTRETRVKEGTCQKPLYNMHFGLILFPPSYWRRRKVKSSLWVRASSIILSILLTTACQRLKSKYPKLPSQPLALCGTFLGIPR